MIVVYFYYKFLFSFFHSTWDTHSGPFYGPFSDVFNIIVVADNGFDCFSRQSNFSSDFCQRLWSIRANTLIK